MASKMSRFYGFRHNFLYTRSMVIILESHLMFLGPKNSMKLSMRLPWVWNLKENPVWHTIWPPIKGIHHNFHFVCSGMITLVSEQMCVVVQNSQNNPGVIF